MLALDEELISHLALADSVWYLFENEFPLYYLEPQESDARQGLEYQYNHIDKYGGPATAEQIAFIFDAEFDEPNCSIKWLVDQFRERYQRNQVIDAIERVGKTVSTDANAAVSEAAELFTDLLEKTKEKKYVLQTKDYFEVLDRYEQQLHQVQGGIFGFKQIDEHTGGLNKGRLYIIVARPKQNKSWMELFSAYHTSLAGKRAVVFSLEMSEDEMFRRYICMASGISYSRFEAGKLSDKEIQVIGKEMSRLADGTQVTIASPPVGERSVAKMVSMAKDLGADVIYIDQMKFIETTARVSDDLRHVKIEYICEELKNACSDIPIMVAAQFNREAANLTEMADLSKIGLSDSIGQTADLLMGIYQSKEMRKNNLFELGIIASRFCQPISWEMISDVSLNSRFRCLGEKE